jgi:hypothetical protein
LREDVAGLSVAYTWKVCQPAARFAVAHRRGGAGGLGAGVQPVRVGAVDELDHENDPEVVGCQVPFGHAAEDVLGWFGLTVSTVNRAQPTDHGP